MKKFRQLIRECGEGTVMYNHLHMNLLKAGLVRSRGMGTAGRARSRGRGRSRGRARQQHATAVISTAVNCQSPQEIEQHNRVLDSREVNDLPQSTQATHGPVNLVKRSNFPQEPGDYYCLNLSRNKQDGHPSDSETNSRLQPVRPQQYPPHEALIHPLNLATQKMPSFATPSRENDRTGSMRDLPMPAPLMPAPVNEQVIQNDRQPFFTSFPGHLRSLPRSAPNVGVAFVREIVDCIFPELAYRPLAAEGREYLEVTRREAILLPVRSRGATGALTALCPCHPARILVSPEGKVEFQAAYKTLCTVEALAACCGAQDSTAWRKSVLECVQSLTAEAGYRFCRGLGLVSQQQSSAASLRHDDIMTSDFGLGFRSASCELWFQPGPRDEVGLPVDAVNLPTSTQRLEDVNMATRTNALEGGEEETLDSTTLFVSEAYGACAQCSDVIQRNLREGRRKQRNPRKMKQ